MMHDKTNRVTNKSDVELQSYKTSLPEDALSLTMFDDEGPLFVFYRPNDIAEFSRIPLNAIAQGVPYDIADQLRVKYVETYPLCDEPYAYRSYPNEQVVAVLDAFESNRK